MIKLTTLNNTIQFHVIGEDELSKTLKDVYINLINFYNLTKNENQTITIKKAISENNDKNFRPRNEVVAKIYKENVWKIKIGIGKNFKPIQSIEDIQEQFIINIEDYELYKQCITADFEKYDKYEELKKSIKKQSKNNIKKLENF